MTEQAKTPHETATEATAISDKLAGHGRCYVCGENQFGAAHFSCIRTLWPTRLRAREQAKETK